MKQREHEAHVAARTLTYSKSSTIVKAFFKIGTHPVRRTYFGGIITLTGAQELFERVIPLRNPGGNRSLKMGCTALSAFLAAFLPIAIALGAFFHAQVAESGMAHLQHHGSTALPGASPEPTTRLKGSPLIDICGAAAGGQMTDKKPFDTCTNFQVFWKTLDEKYAAFPARLPEGKSWEQIGKQYGGSLTAKSTKKDLLKAIKGAARKLNDAHTGVDTGTKEIDGWKTRYQYEKQMDRLSDNVAVKYATAKLKSFGDGNIEYTRIGDTGYINLDTMSDYADPSSEENDLRIVRKAMKKILAKFKEAGVTSLVIDVRNNDGGSDRVSLEIARFVQGDRSLAWNKQVRNGPGYDDFSPPVPTFVEASYEGAFQGPVAVLTSGRTLSAGETFVMAMRDRDHTVLVGERTSGHFSDEHYARLPNGWRFSYSGERYTDEKGIDYEAQGFPPDIPVAFDPKKFRAGKDVMLERALKELHRH